MTDEHPCRDCKYKHVIGWIDKSHGIIEAAAEVERALGQESE